MPYIPKEDRTPLHPELEEVAKRVETDGQFNYALTYLARAFVGRRGGGYAAHAAALAGLECAKLEHYRTRTAPLEDLKRRQNGDVLAIGDTTAGGW